jgi:hypothetical protein
VETVNERYYNRLLLAHLNDLRGIPQTLDELAELAQARLRKPCLPQCERALEYLQTAGYIERCEATAADAPLWKITADGIRQITKNVKPQELDPLIHGS